MKGKRIKVTDPNALVKFRKYQLPIFEDRDSGLVILHWSRQIGKSYTLAAWAVDRLLTRLQKNDSALVTVLSNSRDNGAEFVIKCQEVCNKLGIAMETQDESPDLTYDNMRMEVRITLGEKIGRIKVLAANPRTARGFSGDLILDEFAFHENSNAIWEAAEPILSSNPDFLCRIASTGNGKHNMFYRMAACSNETPKDGSITKSVTGFNVSRVSRTQAYHMGVKIYSLGDTRKPITPEEARAKALDKRAYDQNYELEFNDENMALLTHELIQSAMRSGIPIDEQSWSERSIAILRAAKHDLHFGMDVGRNRDLSVVAVLESDGQTRRLVAMLRMASMRGPAQQTQIDTLMTMPRLRSGCIDMTGLGTFFVDYLQEDYGAFRIQGVNFATTEPINDKLRAEGRKAETARVTELMATDLLAAFEEHRIEFCVEMDADAVDDLRKPEKIVSPGGRVSIAAVRDEAGHADHFWALALAIRSSQKGEQAGAFTAETINAAAKDNTGSRFGRFERPVLVSRRLS